MWNALLLSIVCLGRRVASGCRLKCQFCFVSASVKSPTVLAARWLDLKPTIAAQANKQTMHDFLAAPWSPYGITADTPTN